MRADVPEVSASSRNRTASIIVFLLGIWVLISPFVLRFTNSSLLWNNVIAGILIMILIRNSRMGRTRPGARHQLDQFRDRDLADHFPICDRYAYKSEPYVEPGDRGHCGRNC
jgi:hypothetical protein